MTDTAQQEQQTPKSGSPDPRLTEILDLLKQLIKTMGSAGIKGASAVQEKAKARASDPDRIEDPLFWFIAYGLIATALYFFIENAVPYRGGVEFLAGGPNLVTDAIGTFVTFGVQYLQIKPLLLPSTASLQTQRNYRRVMYGAYGLDLVVCLSYWPVLEGLEGGWGLVEFNAPNAFKVFVIVASLGLTFWFRNYLRRVK